MSEASPLKRIETASESTVKLVSLFAARASLNLGPVRSRYVFDAPTGWVLHLDVHTIKVLLHVSPNFLSVLIAILGTERITLSFILDIFLRFLLQYELCSSSIGLSSTQSPEVGPVMGHMRA